MDGAFFPYFIFRFVRIGACFLKAFQYRRMGAKKTPTYARRNKDVLKKKKFFSY